MTCERKVTQEQGQQLAKRFGLQFLESSAKEGINIDEIFFTLAKGVKINLDKENAKSNDTSNPRINNAKTPG